MTTTNIILLKALNRDRFKPIKEIQSDLRLLGVNLNQKTIYTKLETLLSKNLCHQKWQEGRKIYGLSEIGEWELDLFKTQLLA
jgi:DNA-binding PadR family transcriptional regulator